MPKLPKSNFPSLGFCSTSVGGKSVPVEWKYTYSSNTGNTTQFANCIIWDKLYWPKEKSPYILDPPDWWKKITPEKNVDDILKKDTENKMYPPRNIVEVSENEQHLEYAVAGMDIDKIEVTVDRGNLVIEYSPDKDERVYKSKGISTKKFRKVLDLDEYWEVKEAYFSNGLLIIVVIRDIPEDKKPQKIKISHK